MSNENQNQGRQEDDAWGSMGFDSPEHQAAPSEESSASDPYGGGQENTFVPEDEVVDVEAAPKKKSKAGIYVAIGIVILIAAAIVWTIFSKMMSVISPASADAGVVVSTPGGDIRPLESAPEPNVALPGGSSIQPASPVAVASPAGGETTSPSGVITESSQPAASPPAASPVAVAASPSASCPDTSDKDREIQALRDQLDAARAKVSDLEAKLKKPAASKPAAAAAPKPTASQAQASSSQNKIVRGKFVEQKPEAKPSEPQVVAADVVRAPVAPQDMRPLTGYSIRAIYPNTGDHKSAHLVDPSGKNVVVRVGDVLRTGARIIRINVDEWRVVTTDGEIR